MRFSEIDPFIRFAESIYFQSEGEPVYVRDNRIFYVLSGQARIRIDQQSFDLRPHTVFFGCAGSRYSICSSGVELICLNFDFTQQHSHRELPHSPVKISPGTVLPTANCSIIEDQTDLNGYIFLENGAACRELLEQILEEFSTRRILYRETGSALLKALLVQLLRGQVATGTAVEKVMDYIRTHYREHMPNALFSRLSGYHEYYINRLFAKHTGSTIRQYILDVRISHAKKLLLNTDLPLSAISEQVGFNSNTYFSSYFRKITGISPAQFRKRYKNAI